MYVLASYHARYIASYTAYANPFTAYFATETEGLPECGVTK